MIDTSKFYVISVVSNPVRYQKRWTLFKQFQEHISEVGGKLLSVEQAFGNREFQATERDNIMHLQLRTQNELWHKENMINIGIQYLCQIDPDWKYVAWVDGDIEFQRRDIIIETVQQLQHYDWVQMFSDAIDFGPNGETLRTHKSFMYQYHKLGDPKHYFDHFNCYGYYGAHKGDFWHPGWAWAARREAIDKLPLLDRAILGSGDHHMALGLIGMAQSSLPKKISKPYKNYIMNWQDMATFHIRRNVGYVTGSIIHFWHGKKKNRKYVERWDVLTKNKYNPYTDVIEDAQGLLRLNEHQGKRFIKLRDEIRNYFRQRNEDSIDLE